MRADISTFYLKPAMNKIDLLSLQRANLASMKQTKTRAMLCLQKISNPLKLDAVLGTLLIILLDNNVRSSFVKLMAHFTFHLINFYYTPRMWVLLFLSGKWSSRQCQVMQVIGTWPEAEARVPRSHTSAFRQHSLWKPSFQDCNHAPKYFLKLPWEKCHSYQLL